MGVYGVIGGLVEVTRLGHLIMVGGGGVRECHRRAYGSNEAWSSDQGRGRGRS